MNYLLVSKYLGHFSAAMAALMLPSMIWSVYFAEWTVLLSFLEAMAISLVAGLVLSMIGRNASKQLFQRETLAMVGLGWLLLAFLGGLPFWTSGELTLLDAYFESMSGFTTTGASILTDIEALPKSLLFWRSFTHWLGGMGIIVLFIAVLPYLGAGGKQLFKSEAPGPDPHGFSPRIKDTASMLYKIYFGFTVLQTILLMLAGMSFFDALCHTFGTLATGGFSTYSASVGHFNSLAIEVIIIVFMVLAGTNFALFFAMILGDWKAPLKNTEWRVYMFVLLIATILITINLMGIQGQVSRSPEIQQTDYTFGHALRAAAFQVVTITTTTGYATEDFNQWPYFSRVVLVLLMFVGGCAGSTGGGIKFVRFIILAKMTYWRLEHTFRPKTIRPIRLGDNIIDADIQRTVYGFFVLHVFIFALGSMILSLLGLPFETATTAVIATLNNIGPGLELVGAIENYAFVPDLGKGLMILFMAMGRLELFCICVMFIPSFWKHS